MDSRVLLACADPREGDRIRAAGRAELAVLGVGKAAAAARLAAALAVRRPAVVVLLGVCGAFPAGHARALPVLDVLDLCVVADSVLADDGVATDDGFVGLAALGLGSDGPWAADPERTRRAAAQLGVPAVRAATVSCCSGTDAASAEIARRTAAQVETMESAAVALVCAEAGVPLLEVRCVSNRTGARAGAGFRLRDAAERAQAAVLTLLDAGVVP